MKAVNYREVFFSKKTISQKNRIKRICTKKNLIPIQCIDNDDDDCLLNENEQAIFTQNDCKQHSLQYN